MVCGRERAFEVRSRESANALIVSVSAFSPPAVGRSSGTSSQPTGPLSLRLAANVQARKRRKLRDSYLLRHADTDGLEALSKSGWLSRGQLAANEFCRRVALERGVGLSTSAIALGKRKNKWKAEVSSMGGGGMRPLCRLESFFVFNAKLDPRGVYLDGDDWWKSASYFATGRYVIVELVMRVIYWLVCRDHVM